MKYYMMVVKSMRKYIVNNKEVEYLHIEEKDGATVVTFEEKFNIVNAHMSVIMERLRENELNCLVFKDIKHKIISILVKDDDMSKVHFILHVLNIPVGSYDVMYDDCTIVVDIPKLEELTVEELKRVEVLNKNAI